MSVEQPESRPPEPEVVAQRAAGQHARARTRRLKVRGVAAIAFIAATGVLAASVVGFFTWTFFTIELVILAGLFAIDRWYAPVVERWGRGARGEEVVGAVIAELVDDGWHAIHDVSLGRGNIDHILVGPAGLLTVETKSHGGRINATQIDERMLKQAYAQSKLLSQISGRDVAPLLVFSRAFLYPRPVSRQRGVVVLPARMLRGHLARRTQVLTPEEVSTLHSRLLHALEFDAAQPTSSARRASSARATCSRSSLPSG